MNRGEIAEFIIEPEYAYGERGSSSRPQVHKNAKLRYVIQFFSWRPALNDRHSIDDMSSEERLALAITYKNEATSYYRCATRAITSARSREEGRSTLLLLRGSWHVPDMCNGRNSTVL